MIVAACAALIGLGVAFYAAEQGASLGAMALYCLAAVLAGVVLALWLLCLGYVYADARRRSMRAVLWVLVAALFPHLLGFLLYFVLRQPLASTCPHCGSPVVPGQPFCPWCGTARAPSNPAGVRSGNDSFPRANT